jgi:hypothetical protein
MISVSRFQTETAWYRAKANKARERAESALSEDARKVLLNGGRLWDRIADYEEEDPTRLRPTASP